MPTLSKILVYPIKSLDGVALESAAVLPSGPLEWDRRFAIVDQRGEVLFGKSTPALHSIRAAFDIDSQSVRLRLGAIGDAAEDTTKGEACDWELFSLATEADRIAEWISGVVKQRCRLVENKSQGFPDDPEMLGPTVVSTATLREVAGWFDGLSIDEVRRRFRTNLEIDAPAPFWEDQLVGATRLRPVRFQIGSVEFLGRNPCARCPVPTRSSQTGEVTPRFAKTFAERREESLPEYAPRERFDHFYRLAVNTSLANAEGAQRIQVGDSVALSSSP